MNYYEIEGSCLKILVAMCYGLCDDDGNPLISFEVEPWKSFPVMQIHLDSMSERTTPTSEGNNSVMVSLGKSIEKHGQSLIDVVRIDAKQKVTLAKIQEEEN